MSHSIGSAPSSMGSNGSKRFSRRYRTVNMRSEVDENLFGAPNRVRQAQMLRDQRLQHKSNSANDLRKSDSLCGSPERGSGKKAPNRSYIKHVTKDLIRDILVPEEAGPKSVVIDKDTYGRLLRACTFKTKEDLEYTRREEEKDKDQIVQEINERKKMIQKYDNERKKNEKLDEIDQLAKEEAEYLLKRANELREEQEDEVKRLNELILNVKVHAIRDAQLNEKKVIKRELEEEEKRIDIMMEVDRLNAIKIQEEIERKRKIDMQQGAKVIQKQIEENRQEKLIADEIREQENSAMVAYLEKLQREDWEQAIKRKEQQKKLAGELRVANKDMEKQKEIRKQQDIVADLKVLEYQKEKAARDAALEAEQERKRVEKEKDVARLRAMQERARDLQAEKDTLRAKREQEKKEREWREKVKQDAYKKKQTDEEMRLAREWQIKNKEHYLSVEAAKDRSEFQKVLKAQLELAEKERMEDEKRHTKQKKYTDNLQSQIRENELVRIQERKSFFEEGARLDDEAKARRVKIDEIKRKKLDELRRAGVPDKYCAEIERKTMGNFHIST